MNSQLRQFLRGVFAIVALSPIILLSLACRYGGVILNPNEKCPECYRFDGIIDTADSVILQDILDLYNADNISIRNICYAESARVVELYLFPSRTTANDPVPYFKRSIDTLYDRIFDLPDVRTIYLTGQPIRVIPSGIGRMSNLERLFVDNGYSLTKIEDGIGNAQKLRSIFAKYSNIASLPEAIGQCTSLSYLDLSSNNLTALPSSIGNLTNLATFYANDNLIDSLPSSFSNCNNLYTLYLQRNKLKGLGNINFSGMIHLREFLCHANEITAISPTIMTLDSLYRIEVRANRLCSVDSSMAQWLTVKDSAWAQWQTCSTGVTIVDNFMPKWIAAR